MFIINNKTKADIKDKINPIIEDTDFARDLDEMVKILRSNLQQNE